MACLQGDGGAMYTLAGFVAAGARKPRCHNGYLRQSLLRDPQYRIDAGRVGVEHPGPTALSMLDLHDPTLDWLSLGAGLGVEASRAHTVEEFSDQFERAMRQVAAPRFIEVAL